MTTTSPTPPSATVRPQHVEAQGDARIDNYFWLRDRDNPEVLAYLEAENAYTTAVMRHTEELKERI